jgi:Domain of unknown function (DUF5664)
MNFDDLEIGDLITSTEYEPHHTGYVVCKSYNSIDIEDERGYQSVITRNMKWKFVAKKPRVGMTMAEIDEGFKKGAVTKADRKNSGKPRPTQLDWDFVNDIMIHMHKSEVKYPDKNGQPNYWSNFDSVIQQAHNSLIRHTMDLARGILVDPESGTDTVICIATNCMIINKHKEQYIKECKEFFRKDKTNV